MDVFTASEAARWLGISVEAVSRAAREGRLPVVSGEGPRQFARDAVEAYHLARVRERVAALARMRETPASVARKVRRALDDPGTGLPRSFAAKLAAMPELWRRSFSKAELAAACVREGEGCRWCAAQRFSAVLGLRPPEYSPALRALFAGEPCAGCGEALFRPVMESLRARVFAGSGGGCEPRSEVPVPQMRAQPRPARTEAPTAAQPVDVVDDGKGVVQQRLKEVRARLAAARRRGDTGYAQQLAAQVRALEADAARVEGRPVAPRGRKACGTPVGTRCECHVSDRRRASRRSAR